MSELRIENRSERDLRSCELKQLQLCNLLHNCEDLFHFYCYYCYHVVGFLLKLSLFFSLLRILLVSCSCQSSSLSMVPSNYHCKCNYHCHLHVNFRFSFNVTVVIIVFTVASLTFYCHYQYLLFHLQLSSVSQLLSSLSLFSSLSLE